MYSVLFFSKGDEDSLGSQIVDGRRGCAVLLREAGGAFAHGTRNSLSPGFSALICCGLPSISRTFEFPTVLHKEGEHCGALSYLKMRISLFPVGIEGLLREIFCGARITFANGELRPVGLKSILLSLRSQR